MTTSIFILIWLVPCIIVSLAIGSIIGYSFALRRHGKLIYEERQKTLAALQQIFDSADELTSEVGTHNSELESVGRCVDDLATDGAYEQVKQTLLGQIAAAIESNRRLENDLVCTKYRLEAQAQELDRTRMEARRDPLSGVGNRKAFDESLQFMASKFYRHGTPFSLLMIDVDHFKWINDTHGHQAGDLVVERLGAAFRGAVRPKDHVARFGGDEFGILFERANAEGAARAALRVREQIEQCDFDVGLNDARVAVTLSMGLATCEANDSPSSLLRKADAALYRSKEAGRNRLTIYDPSMELAGCS